MFRRFRTLSARRRGGPALVTWCPAPGSGNFVAPALFKTMPDVLMADFGGQHEFTKLG